MVIKSQSNPINNGNGGSCIPVPRTILRDLWLVSLLVLTLFVSTATMLWCSVNPRASVEHESITAKYSDDYSQKEVDTSLVGGYRSLQEMKDRAHRFPLVHERVAVYMSNWYSPPCRDENQFLGPHVAYNYLGDSQNGPPLLAMREIAVDASVLGPIDHGSSEEGNTTDHLPDLLPRKFSHSGSNRTFVLDSTILDKGARVFFLRANEVRRCNDHSCEDTLKFVFPSLYRVDMSANSKGYPGNALDLIDGNSNDVVPVILQFGDMEVSRGFVPGTNKNETYPLIPVFKKFRLALPKDELLRITAQSCVSESQVPLTVAGAQRVQPIVAKFTYKRHYGMLEEIPPVDIPWHEKKDQAIFRGALTGMKRNGFRVVLNSATHSKKDMCSQIQRCKLILDYHGSSLVDASLVDVLATHPNNILIDPVVPPVLDGVHLYGPRLSFEELLKYKAIVMLEGNDVSTGLKWALYSSSVVLTQPATYTSWAMEELLVPWVHYVPLNDDLSDVEEKVLWVLNNQEKAQKIAHNGKLWISDLAFHPDSYTDENAILDEMLQRYKHHFVHNDGLSIENILAS